MKQRDYEDRNQLKGLCACCPKKRDKRSKRFCPFHLKKNRLKQRRHKERHFGKLKE